MYDEPSRQVGSPESTVRNINHGIARIVQLSDLGTYSHQSCTLNAPTFLPISPFPQFARKSLQKTHGWPPSPIPLSPFPLSPFLPSPVAQEKALFQRHMAGFVERRWIPPCEMLRHKWDDLRNSGPLNLDADPHSWPSDDCFHAQTW